MGRIELPDRHESGGELFRFVGRQARLVGAFGALCFSRV
jgi:hypothetical protein